VIAPPEIITGPRATGSRLRPMSSAAGQFQGSDFDGLVTRALAGERDAWEELVERLHRVAWRAIGGFDLAVEDRKDAFAATSSFESGMPGGHYRHQLWVPFPHGRVLLALGIHGQMLYVDQATRTVGVKLSSWPMPQDAVRFHDTLTAFGSIAADPAAVDDTSSAQAHGQQ